MGRPIKKQIYFDHHGKNGTAAPHQIQSTTWGPADTAAVPGYLTKQNSTNRFRAKTSTGASLTTLCNGTPTSAGFSSVKVFPVGSDPSTYAAGTANLKVVNAALVAGGVQYHANDVLQLVGGTYGHVANIVVNSVFANNAVNAFTLSAVANQGYTALPSNLAAVQTTDFSNANASGAIFSINFGLESVTVTNVGAGYTSANIVFPQATTAPVTTNFVVGGSLVNNVAVTSPGVINVANPTIIFEGTSNTVEYVKQLKSAEKLLTFQGNTYHWLAKGIIPPDDYDNLNIKLAYLDTL